MKALLFRANEFYNRHLEQKLAHSPFAGGGVAAMALDRTLAHWLRDVHGLVLDVGCGDRKAERLLGPRCRYVGLDYPDTAADSPWRVAHPDVHADGLQLPIRDAAVDCVLNVLVLEHVESPEKLVSELARVLRPGGVLLLAGPGDITMSHGEPHNYFNMTRFAYRLLLDRQGLQIEEEAFPARFWVSVLILVYNNVVRNDFYNRHPLAKLVQVPVLLVSLLVSPLANAVAWMLDAILPFDRRGYALYAVRARKLGTTAAAVAQSAGSI